MPAVQDPEPSGAFDALELRHREGAVARGGEILDPGEQSRLVDRRYSRVAEDVALGRLLALHEPEVRHPGASRHRVHRRGPDAREQLVGGPVVRAADHRDRQVTLGVGQRAAPSILRQRDQHHRLGDRRRGVRCVRRHGPEHPAGVVDKREPDGLAGHLPRDILRSRGVDARRAVRTRIPVVGQRCAGAPAAGRSPRSAGSTDSGRRVRASHRSR